MSKVTINMLVELNGSLQFYHLILLIFSGVKSEVELCVQNASVSMA